MSVGGVGGLWKASCEDHIKVASDPILQAQMQNSESVKDLPSLLKNLPLERHTELMV